MKTTANILPLSRRRINALLHAEKVAQELRFQIGGVPPAQMNLGPACEHLSRYIRLAGKRAFERPDVKTWRNLPIGPKLP